MNKFKLVSFIKGKVLNSTDEIPWGVKITNAPQMWEKGIKGDGVVTAILDTGCDLKHDDLKDRIIGGKNFTTDYHGNANNFSDNYGHGTHVAGIIAAANNNSGIVGMAPNSKLLILKVLCENGIGNQDWITNAINYCINWTGPNKEKVRIISMSLSGPKYTVSMHNAIKNAIKNNILIICSAGNNGDGNLNTEELEYPGAFPEVIEVGAIDENKKLSHFSNTNNAIDIVAPGVNILSTFLNNQYIHFSGTSMAAPHVAGGAALIINKYQKEYNKYLNEQELYNILLQNVEFIGYSQSGASKGLLNLKS